MVSNSVGDGAHGAISGRRRRFVSLRTRRRRQTRVTGGSNVINDAGPLRACRVTRGVDYQNPILSNEEAADDVAGAKSLGTPVTPASDVSDG